MKRREFIRATLAGAALTTAWRETSGAAPATQAGSFRFVHLTDLHVQPELGGEEGLAKAVQAVNALEPAPDFVITGGDLVMDALEQDYQRADRLFDVLTKCLDKLAVPVHHVIGNHDIFGWYPWSTVNRRHPEFGKKMFEKRLGEGRTWRSFDHKGWHFVLLDSLEWDKKRTDYVGVINQRQIDWLKDDLAALDSSTPVTVVTHIPFVSVVEQSRRGGGAAFGPGLAVVNSDQVLKMFDEHKLKLILQGHLHRDEALRLEGRQFVMSGAVCGAWWRGPNYGTQEGFSVFDIRGEEFSFFYHDYGWEAKSGGQS